MHQKVDICLYQQLKGMCYSHFSNGVRNGVCTCIQAYTKAKEQLRSYCLNITVLTCRPVSGSYYVRPRHLLTNQNHAMSMHESILEMKSFFILLKTLETGLFGNSIFPLGNSILARSCKESDIKYLLTILKALMQMNKKIKGKSYRQICCPQFI